MTGPSALVLEHYASALWGGSFKVGFAGMARSSFDGRELWLPTSDDAALGRARAAHAAAHTVFSGGRFEPGALKPLQQVLVGLFEDARVEALAMQRFPGLRRLWTPFHETTAPSSSLPARLARALFDADHAEPDSWILKARSAFHALDLEQSTALDSRRLGNLLGNDLGQMRWPFDAKSYVVEPAYRDDHAGLWERPPAPAKSVSPSSAKSHDESAFEPEAAPSHTYPEWDYVIERLRPCFCEVHEQSAAAGEPPSPAPAGVVRRVRRSLRRALLSSQQMRRESEGPELDLKALVDAAGERRAGVSPSRLMYRRAKRLATPRSVLLLLDLSESSNIALADGCRAHALSSLCAQLLCGAELPGLELAIDGFRSYGRRDVRYQRFKDFSERGSSGLERLGELQAAGSTRLGAALRHGCARLKSRRARERLLLVVTDADPADVDIYDARYLVEDARAAVDSARRAGIGVFACCLPGGEARAAQRIFGRQQAPLTRIGELPQRLGAALSARRAR